jgi:hypothetical protein
MRRRAAFVVIAGGLLAMLVWSSAMAMSVKGTITVNGKTSGPVTVLINGTASTKGVTDYDSWIGPIPWPTYGCFLQSVPYWPFYRPTITGGNQPIITPTVAINEVTGATGWNFRYKFNVTGNYTASLNTSAKAEFKSGSTAYYITSGTGIKDCGASGNLYYTTNPLVQVITK